MHSTQLLHYLQLQRHSLEEAVHHASYLNRFKCTAATHLGDTSVLLILTLVKQSFALDSL